MSSPQALRYRPEIDGLRAIAVLAVILFHAGFAPFGGGFVGVDIFFVISGYLIGSIVLVEKRAGRFSLANFYERRARRILPALFFVLLASLPAAWAWLFPADLQDFSNSLVAVAAFVSNIFFWQTTGYFETSAELKPLLHTWSLAVEEQYYLLFPITFIGLWKYARRWIAPVFALLALASLAVSQFGTRAWPAAAFFLLSSRAWELLIGVLAALYSLRTRPAIPGSAWNQAAAACGLFAILFSIFSLDEKTAFPGISALLPTLGAALVILFATPQTLVAKALSGRLLVGIGLISYSAYLWHQPLFAFARHASLEKPGALLLSSLSAATLLLALLTWKYVEQPFRSRERIGRKQLVRCAAGCAFLLVLLGAVGDASQGFAARLSDSERRLLDFRFYDYRPYYREGECFLMPEQSYQDFSALCAPGAATGGPMIWGDSHAAALSHGLRTLKPELAQYTASGCPPLGEADFGAGSRCRRINDFVLARLRQLRPAVIYLHADWSRYGLDDLARRLEKTIGLIQGNSPQSRIVLVGGVPHWYPSLPGALVRRHVALDRPRFSEGADLDRVQGIDRVLGQVAARHDGKVEFFSALDALCARGACQAVVLFDGAPMPTAADYGHLTAGGSLLLAGKLLAR